MPFYLQNGTIRIDPGFLEKLEASITTHALQMQAARRACWEALKKHEGEEVRFQHGWKDPNSTQNGWGNEALNPRNWYRTDGRSLFSAETIAAIMALEQKIRSSEAAQPNKGRQDLWTREQLILTFQLYLKMEFGKMHSRNPEVIALAELIGRSANSVAMRLTNFAAVDPYHKGRGVKGLEGGTKQVEPIWREFNENRDELLYQSELILAKHQHLSLEDKYPELREYQGQTGETKERLVKTRVNQHIFREMVLANYGHRCAITGINIPSLLVASHIVPWSANEKERLNPENGLCLSSLYDRAFDQGLIGITPDLEIRLSERLKAKSKEPYYKSQFENLNGTKLREPQRYFPRREFLAWHWKNIFN